MTTIAGTRPGSGNAAGTAMDAARSGEVASVSRALR